MYNDEQIRSKLIKITANMPIYTNIVSISNIIQAGNEHMDSTALSTSAQV